MPAAADPGLNLKFTTWMMVVAAAAGSAAADASPAAKMIGSTRFKSRSPCESAPPTSELEILPLAGAAVHPGNGQAREYPLLHASVRSCHVKTKPCPTASLTRRRW